MWWLLVWVSLVLVAGSYVGARAWGLWGQTKELASELAIAQRRVAAVQGQRDVLGERVGGLEQLAVFSDVTAARKEHDRVKRAGQRARRRRRAITRPEWVKHVD